MPQVLQNVPLRSVRPDEQNTTMSLVRNGKSETLAFRQDFIAGAIRAQGNFRRSSRCVNVGFGVTAPEQNYDDYKGI